MLTVRVGEEGRGGEGREGAGMLKRRRKERDPTQKGSNERLFILTRTHSMQIFGEIPFIKPQNDTEQINGQKR